jgi:hypothetical protein
MHSEQRVDCLVRTHAELFHGIGRNRFVEQRLHLRCESRVAKHLIQSLHCHPIRSGIERALFNVCEQPKKISRDFFGGPSRTWHRVRYHLKTDRCVAWRSRGCHDRAIDEWMNCMLSLSLDGTNRSLMNRLSLHSTSRLTASELHTQKDWSVASRAYRFAFDGTGDIRYETRAMCNTVARMEVFEWNVLAYIFRGENELLTEHALRVCVEFRTGVLERHSVSRVVSQFGESMRGRGSRL